MNNEKQLKIVIANDDGYGGYSLLSAATIDKPLLEQLISLLTEINENQVNDSYIVLDGTNTESFECLETWDGYFPKSDD